MKNIYVTYFNMYLQAKTAKYLDVVELVGQTIIFRSRSLSKSCIYLFTNLGALVFYTKYVRYIF